MNKPGVAVAVAIAIAVGCSAYDPQQSATARACAAAPPMAHAVTCPGTSTCACPAPDVCCLNSIDAKSGACGNPRACAGLELTCDGPEDCGGGVCCLTATGSSCMDGKLCQGTWLCRSDAQCSGSGASSCVPADFGAPGVSDRALDGRIGLCRNM